MHEYRTKPIDRTLLLTELAAVCDALSLVHVVDVSISFGWDSNLPIDMMWKDQTVPVRDLVSFVTKGEMSGVFQVGKADVFIDAPEFVFVLGHEGDAQVKGRSDLVQQFARRWETLGYSPYEVQQRAQ
jgi:hypothetical protein